MKMKLILSACLAAATLAPVAATAQDHDRVVSRHVVRHEEHRGPGWNRHHTRRVCTWKWRGHHKVRVCRTTRW